MNKIIKVGSYFVERHGDKVVALHDMWMDRASRFTVATYWAMADKRHLQRIISGKAKSVGARFSGRSKIIYGKDFVKIGCTKVRLTTLKRIAKLLS